MKGLKLALLTFTLAMASCHSVSVPFERTLAPVTRVAAVFQPATEAVASGQAQAVIVGQTDGYSHLAQDNETGELLLSLRNPRLDQGRNPGAIEPPMPTSEVHTSPKVWDLTILAGYRNMYAGAWNELQNQGMLGIEAAFYPTALAFLGAEVGLQGSYSRDGERSATGQAYNLDGSVGEIYGGFRTRGHFGRTKWRHAAGVGLGLIWANREDVVSGAVENGDDLSLTFYLHLLLAFDISPGVFFGVDFRGDFGSTMTINGNSGSANYLQAALALGFDL